MKFEFVDELLLVVVYPELEVELDVAIFYEASQVKPILNILSVETEFEIPYSY